MAKSQQHRTSGRRKSGGESEGRSENENKSLTAMVTEGLGDEGQEGVERVMGEVKRYFDSSRDYVAENPKEAAGLAIAAGFAAWALLGTKPGRVILEASSAFIVPQMTRWFSRNISGMMANQIQNH